MANRLIHEQSPYLQQHAHNPVDWYPWGEEAFEKARKENKPVMVSIGYSTCHWCHVMESESFEDEDIAELMNDRFVAIKVDREERPDVDAIYMTACQAMTGHGGWPLNVFVTPDQKPFYAGTYFPKESMRGMPGMEDVITQLYDRYQQDPEKIKEVSEQMADIVQPQTAGHDSVLSEEALAKGFNELRQTFHPTYGGFGNAPKFPTPHVLMYLFRYYRWSGDEQALEMAQTTLDGMASGGMYDHIGGGFARYSVDEKWLVPHFEKMLYDNALLAIAYTEGWQMTGESRFRETAEEVLDYVIRGMQGPDGGFYSGEDADSEGVEGKFYLWTPGQIKTILGEENGSLFCEVYDITEEGNFEGVNIPNLIGQSPEEFAVHHELEPKQIRKRLEQAKTLLFEAREERIHPHTDDKMLTSWNALMTAALARAGRVFDSHEYREAAERAFSFIESHLIKDGRVMVRYREGDVKHKGFIDDYANLLWALLELYECTLEPEYLTKARHYADQMIALFWDEDHGGFYFYGSDAEELLARPKESFDGAMPSGNSTAARELLRLARFTGEMAYEEKVRSSQAAFARELSEIPGAHMHFLQSYLLLCSDMKEVVVLTGEDEEARAMTSALQQQFYPEVTYLIHQDSNLLAEAAPFAAAYHKIEGRTTVYVCRNFACHQPVTQAAEALGMLDDA